MALENHPSVLAFHRRQQNNHPETMTRQRLKAIVLAAGADDVGVVEIDRPSLMNQKEAILHAFPRAKTLVSFLCRMNEAQVRSNDRSLIDGEFIAYDEEMLHISRTVVKALREERVSAVTPSESFPQNMSQWGGRMLTVSHKPVAEAAGLGRMGHHRLLIHPTFGSHLCLGTIIVDTALDAYDQPLDYNPCIACNLCVATCPTGAIALDGSFAFVKCLVHAYRDRLGGFLNWVESLVSSQNMEEYRAKRTDPETMAVWQSLTYGGGYRCGYCMSVCPAGLDLLGPYLDNRQDYIQSVVKPLQERQENVYVLPGEEQTTRLRRSFPNKAARPA
jgi:epoxyqueuosine reductase QueG